LMLFASAGAILGLTGSLAVGANDASGRQSDQQQSQGSQQQGALIEESAGAERASQLHADSFGTVIKGSDFIGAEVKTSSGEKVGEIKDAMVDLKSGRVPFAILSLSGAGIDNRLIAVPPAALQTGTEENRFVLNIDKEKLKTAPSFERNQWPNFSSPEWRTKVYRFYSVPAYWQTSLPKRV